MKIEIFTFFNVVNRKYFSYPLYFFLYLRYNVYRRRQKTADFPRFRGIFQGFLPLKAAICHNILIINHLIIILKKKLVKQFCKKIENFCNFFA